MSTVQHCIELRTFGTNGLYETEKALPAPAANEITVRLTAAALNYRDWLMITGAYNPKQPLPLIPCSDGAGVVERCGADVSEWKPGDRVTACFAPHWLDGPADAATARFTLGGPMPGTLSEFINLPAHGVVRSPEHLNDQECATLGCAGLTAYHALFAVGQIQSGSRVVVQGSGGVSVFALQLARSVGAHVIATTSSAEKAARLTALGANHVIDYKRTPSWGKAVREIWPEGADVVVEVGGAGTLAQSLRAIRMSGKIAIIGVLSGSVSEVLLTHVLMNAVTLQGVFVGSVAMMQAFCAHLDHHRSLRPVISERFALADAAQAFEHLHQGQHVGKIVVA